MKTRILSLFLCVLMLVSMVPVSVSAADVEGDVWDGTADTSWYNDTATSFTLTTAEQLAGLAQLVDGGNTFVGKTIKLGADIDLGAKNPSGERISFNPIGYGYSIVFKGTFDGQYHTIANLYQNGWELGLSYSTEGGGLFASVIDASFKNLVIDNAEVVMECIDMGILVGYSYGTCSYENISIKNSLIANYQRYTGGVVGEVNGIHSFKNVDVDQNTVISSLWGDFDCSLGGIIGGKYGEATITFEDCDVACQINAYNDVTSTYQWYAYRRAGMLIGNAEETKTIDGRTSADTPYLTVTNCTVVYGDWADYTYCEFAGKSWPYVRVQAGYSNDAYSNPRYGHPTDANGKEVVDDNHTHNDGEDHQILCEFNQLFGGGQGVYGEPEKPGTEVHKIDEESIANKTYVLMSDETGHWYATEGSNAKLLYTKHYDEEAKLISGQTAHYYECDACGAAFGHEAHDHVDEWQSDPTGHWHFCSICRSTYGFAPHQESDWIIDTDAEIGVEGEQHKECEICHYSPLSTEVIPAKEQPFDYVLFALAARYAQRFDVLVSAENATVTGDLSIKYKRSGTVDIDVADGYQLIDVIANGQSLGAVTSVTFKKVMAPQTLVVVTDPIPTEEPAEETPAA